jgi:hypothetical protein
MEVKLFHNILLLALVKAYDGRRDAYMMLEQIAPAIRRIEQNQPQLLGVSAGATSALITLDTQKLIRIDRGRIYLLQDGIIACRGLALAPEWAGLPEALKAYIKP